MTLFIGFFALSGMIAWIGVMAIIALIWMEKR
jgi:hypothetical protein